MIGDRIRLARDYAGLTQQALADTVGLQQATIAYLESGRHRPSEAVLRQIAEATGFPLGFFHDAPLDAFPEGSLAFRRRKRTPAYEVRRAYSTARLAWELVRSLLQRVKPWTVRLPMLPGETPETAAAITRSSLGFAPEQPLHPLVGNVEALGVPVLELHRELADLDGFSLWAGWPTARPLIAVHASTPGDRQRWTVAHELGHLVLHGAVRGSVEAVEREADAFAAELLLPETALREELVPPVTLSQLMELKARWRVSLAALIRRAHDLGVISDRRQTDLFMQLNKQGWRKTEPVPIARERSQTVAQLIRAVYGRDIPLDAVLAQEHLPQSLAEVVVMDGSRLRVVR